MKVKISRQIKFNNTILLHLLQDFDSKRLKEKDHKYEDEEKIENQ